MRGWEVLGARAWEDSQEENGGEEWGDRSPWAGRGEGWQTERCQASDDKT